VRLKLGRSGGWWKDERHAVSMSTGRWSELSAELTKRPLFIAPASGGVVSKPRLPNLPANQGQSRLATRNLNKNGLPFGWPESSIDAHNETRKHQDKSASSEESSKEEKPERTHLERDTGSTHQAAVIACASIYVGYCRIVRSDDHSKTDIQYLLTSQVVHST